MSKRSRVSYKNSENITNVGDVKGGNVRIGGGGETRGEERSEGNDTPRRKTGAGKPRTETASGNEKTDKKSEQNDVSFDGCSNITNVGPVSGDDVDIGGGGQRTLSNATPTPTDHKGVEQKAYNMDADPRGLCYIFNNKKFFEKGERFGTEKDKDVLEKVFESLKFKVHSFDDLDADVIDILLKKLAEKDHSKYNCLVVIFLTHGQDGVIMGSDDEKLSITKITDYFKVESLIDKPKLFFFQSCRGTKFVNPAKGAKSETTSQAKGAKSETEVSAERDFFFGYATISGSIAQRSPEYGGWYIQDLAKTFEEQAHSEDLLSMMTVVKERVGEHKCEYEGGVIRQTAESTSRLTKKLFFMPKGESK